MIDHAEYSLSKPFMEMSTLVYTCTHPYTSQFHEQNELKITNCFIPLKILVHVMIANETYYG